MVTISHLINLINFGNSILNSSNWDKISEVITKKSISGTE